MSDPYVLGRSYSAAARLNLQHYLWKDALQFNLHPSILTPTAGQRIADIATGTGIWMLDLTPSLPANVSLDGMDISLVQAPPTAWLPPNVSLREWDLFSPVPADLVGKFDVVHIRLVLLVIQNNDAAPAIRNLAALLKPGGYLQWDELDGFNMRVVSVARTEADPPPAFAQMAALMDGNNRHEWVLRLPDTMDHLGFEDAALHTYHDRPALSKANTEMLLMMLEEFAANIARVQGTEAGARLVQLIQDINVEAADGFALDVPKVVCVARKRRD